MVHGREGLDFMEIYSAADGRGRIRFHLGECSASNWQGRRATDAQCSRMADRRPIPFESKVFDDPDYQRFLSFTYWLQMFVSPCDVIVPCRKLGELLGPSHTTISKYRCWAGLGKGKSDGLLKETRKFIYSGGVKRATCCKFLIEKLPQPWSTIDWWK